MAEICSRSGIVPSPEERALSARDIAFKQFLRIADLSSNPHVIDSRTYLVALKRGGSSSGSATIRFGGLDQTRKLLMKRDRTLCALIQQRECGYSKLEGQPIEKVASHPELSEVQGSPKARSVDGPMTYISKLKELERWFDRWTDKLRTIA